ncbi:MAG TPA: chemotaxis response regulator protein-glutamate methylesterase [Ruminiclostridium sp.]|nr:chemotaxis response regulator protein-glutamate methylesterase [Ruminiclostridium sp.]
MKIKRKIRVLVVDDSMVFRETIVKGLSSDPGLEVVGTAADAFEARDKIIELNPDVMTLDVEMPKMNGVEFVRKLMPQYPLPVVMVSALTDTVFDALNAGAVDFVGKPDNSGVGIDSFINEMIIKVKIASTAKVGRLKRLPITETGKPNSDAQKVKNDLLIAIGASTGGTEAILEVVKELPREIPGIVIVQHMPPVFTKMYADRLNDICKIEVKEAKNGDVVRPGLALLAPGSFQMQVMRDSSGYYVKCYEGEKVNGHAPSVDVLFDSVAKNVGDKATGIILTGMGNDGAKGLLNMRKNGAFTIGQDEKTAVVYGMPMVAYNIGAVERQCPLNSVAGVMLDHLKEKNSLS